MKVFMVRLGMKAYSPMGFVYAESQSEVNTELVNKGHNLTEVEVTEVSVTKLSELPYKR